jgi:hypothetical protein
VDAGTRAAPSFVLAWGILLLSTGLALGFTASHLLRASVRGFELRAVGASPLAAVAAGVDVDAMQTLMAALGGACAGLVGALQLWSDPAIALERWPVPLGFAGITVALLGAGHLRGAIAAARGARVWLNTPGVPVASSIRLGRRGRVPPGPARALERSPAHAGAGSAAFDLGGPTPGNGVRRSSGAECNASRQELTVRT